MSIQSVDSEGEVLDSKFVASNNFDNVVKQANQKIRDAYEQQLENAFGDKVDEATGVVSREKITEVIDKIPILKSKYDGFDGRLSLIQLSPAFSGSDGAYAQTFGDPSDPNTRITMTVFRSAFNSHRLLAGSIFHEFVHVQDYVSGRIYGDYSAICTTCTHGNAWDGALALSELRAYRLTKEVTGIEYKNSHGYNAAIDYVESNSIPYPDN
ncbi:MAG: hypothetical protein AAF489_06680 [Bacteroidota bacterium]